MALLRCPDHGYTLAETCRACGKPTARAGPARYSPQDPYGMYRRKLKLIERAKATADPKGASR